MRQVAALLFLLLPAAAQERVDLGIVDRIKSEAFDRSRVMDHLYYLTEVYGPRLTGSPEFEQAAKWAMDRLKGYGGGGVEPERTPFFGSGRHHAVGFQAAHGPRCRLLGPASVC